jgi:hypothetical protein
MKGGIVHSNGVGKEENQSLIDKWSEQMGIEEFISAGDVSANVLRRLLRLVKDGLVWQQVMTNGDGWLTMPGVDWYGRCEICAQLDHLSSKCSGSKGLGWSAEGFFVANKTSPFWGDFRVEDYLPCTLCNADSSSESTDEACSDCEGQGFCNVVYKWPGDDL